MEKITLKLTVQELQTALRALGNLPYVQVQDLIGNIQLQAAAQLQGMDGKDETAKVPSAKEAKKTEKVA